MALRLSALPIVCDRHGPVVTSLQRAVEQGASVLIYQPRGQLPLGHAVSKDRLAELAEVLRCFPHVRVIEDDNLGPLSAVQAPSTGSILPDRTLLVRSYCKTYGIDLRVCVIGGAGDLVLRMRQLRSHGTAMTSRILQGALAFLLKSEEANATLSIARERYSTRRATLADALRARGLEVSPGEGLILWLTVPDEDRAIVNLAARGVTVGSGSRCYIERPVAQHLRIATSRLPDDSRLVQELASIIKSALNGTLREEYD